MRAGFPSALPNHKIKSPSMNGYTASPRNSGKDHQEKKTSKRGLGLTEGLQNLQVLDGGGMCCHCESLARSSFLVLGIAKPTTHIYIMEQLLNTIGIIKKPKFRASSKKKSQ